MNDAVEIKIYLNGDNHKGLLLPRCNWIVLHLEKNVDLAHFGNISQSILKIGIESRKVEQNIESKIGDDFILNPNQKFL